MEYRTSQQYLNQVRHFLVCDKIDQKRLLERCKNLVNSFQQENPGTGYAGIIVAFGKPEDCAKELLSTLDDSKVESARQKRLWLHGFIVVCVLSILILLSFFWHSKYQQSTTFDENVIVIVESPIETTLEEFYITKEQENQINGGK